jgi:osmotically-inducible protein OsmY
MDSFRASRPDVDIEEDVAQIIRSYPPLQMSRPYFTYKSLGGVIQLRGNVRTPQARRVLVENAARIAGVSQVDDTDLFDDEALRMAVGDVIGLSGQSGVYATVHGGVVALTGNKLAHDAAASLINAVQAIPGVRRVGAALE